MRMLSTAPAAGVLAAIDRLVTVIECENAALAAGRREPIEGLLDGKRAACHEYEEAVRAMLGNSPIDLSIDDASRRALQSAMERLGRVSAENRRRLVAAIAAHKRLLEIVATTMRELSPSASGYVRNGAPSRGKISPIAPPAVSFDRAL
jgi:hypothetical protein